MTHQTHRASSRPRRLASIVTTVAGLLVAAAPGATSAIFYDGDANCIRVVDFPQAAPCTLRRLLQMDRRYGWGKVQHDPATDTYTVRADLAIGTNDGSETYFQIGGAEHPREVLLMDGRLVVQPYWVQGENRGASYWRAPRKANRVTLGVAGDPSVQAALKFRGDHTLYVGREILPGGALKTGYGGQLHVHYGTITTADPGQPFGPKNSRVGMCLAGDSIVLDHATLSQIRGFATYGMGQNAEVNDTLFEDCGSAIINGRHNLRNCTFRRCGVAIRDYGSLDAVLTNCTFESNKANWWLTFTNKGLVCIDCTWDTPSKGNQFRCWTSRRTKQKQYPCLVSKRHVIVEVLGSNGKPVQGAKVRVRSERGATALAENSEQTTDRAGRTPGQGSADAILLTEFSKRATDAPNQPSMTRCSYSIRVTAAGLPPREIKGFSPERSWQVVRVVIQR